jgi:murein L,D-transpeptidase YafK
MIKIFFIMLLLPLTAKSSLLIDEIKIYKSEHQMSLLYHGNKIKNYTIMLGRGGLEPKKQEGDNLVPEGKYTLDEKNINSKFHRSIHITYPNNDDIERAQKDGVNPGGEIFIHGLPNYKLKSVDWLMNQLVKIKDHTKRAEIQKKLDWTMGCIAVSNKEIEEIYDNLSTPLPITIYP